MADITPNTRFAGQRGHIIHTQPWPVIIEHYRQHGGPSLQSMFHLVEAIAASRVSTQLFAATSMFDLLISDCENFRMGDSTLRIAYHAAECQFEFFHHTSSGHDDHKTCSETEALQTLRLFLKLKYGVLFE